MRRIDARRPVIVGTDIGSRRHRPDYGLVVIITVLSVLGLIVVYAISPGLSAQTNVNDNYFVNKQMIAILLAVVTFITVSRVSITSWKTLLKPLLALTVVALIATQYLGEEINGASRWVQIGGLSFQAVELVKFALILWLAQFLAKQHKAGLINSLDKTIKPVGYVLLALAFVVAIMQSDLGSMGVIAAIIGAMLFVGGLSLRWIGIGIATVLIGGALLVAGSSYRQERIATFLNPQADCQTEGYQACQALIAVGSGGMFGKGLNRSTQAYGYLPEAANDSIFAVVAEMFGFLGVSIMLGLFVGLFTRLVKIIERTPNLETRLLVVGVLAWISTQAFINIMAMVGLFPLKGITLPFISYGGTSLIFISAAVGLAFNISRYTTYSVHDISGNTNQVKRSGSAHENIAQRRRNGRPHYAHSIRRP
ncbi:stage V sporulation protein E [soil metagenome]